MEVTIDSGKLSALLLRCVTIKAVVSSYPRELRPFPEEPVTPMEVQQRSMIDNYSQEIIELKDQLYKVLGEAKREKEQKEKLEKRVKANAEQKKQMETLRREEAELRGRAEKAEIELAEMKKAKKKAEEKATNLLKVVNE